MDNRSIVPVLVFIANNHEYLDLDRWCVFIGINPHTLYYWATEARKQALGKDIPGAAVNRWGFVDSLPHETVKAIREMGYRFGVLYKGTDYLIHNPEARISLDADHYNPDDEGVVHYAKSQAARVLGDHLLETGMISFETIPWQQVKQKPEYFQRIWELVGRIKVLKEK